MHGYYYYKRMYKYMFTILSKSHSNYHLKVLETIHILTHKLSLWKQGMFIGCEFDLYLIYPSLSSQLTYFFKNLISSSSLHKSLPLFLLNHCPHFNCDQRGLKPDILFFLKWLKLVYSWVYQNSVPSHKLYIYIYIYIYI